MPVAWPTGQPTTRRPRIKTGWLPWAACGIAALTALLLWQLDLSRIAGAAIAFFQDRQRQFHDTLATDLHAIRDTGSWLPALGLIGVGFAYGVFHAIGPGHGKLVVTSYMLADDSSLRRGITVVILSSLLQGIVAIVLVLGAYYLFGLARAEAERAAALLEAASFGLVALVGVALFRRGWREAHRLWTARFRPQPAQSHICDYGADHVHDASCGHAHMPTAAEVASARGIGELALMIVSIGIRPCSGAVILLLFACLIGAVVPGVLATLAMAAGTGLTTALLALAAMQSKKLILRRMQSTEIGLAVAHAALGLIGGLLIALLGGLFLIAGVKTELDTDTTGTGGTPAQYQPVHLPPRF